MKKTLKIIIIFLVSLFFFDRSLSLIIQYSENNFFDKGLLEKPLKKYLKFNDINTLLIGTSRTYEAIHPVYLKNIKDMKILKIAFSGHGPKYNYFFYKLYRKINKQPEYLIYGVDYFIFTLKTSIGVLSDIVIDEPYKIRINLLSPSLLLLKNKFWNDIFLNDFATLLNYKQRKSKYTFLTSLQTYSGQLKHSSSNQKIITKADKKYKRKIYLGIPGVEGIYFEKLLGLLKKDNVKVILISIPEYIGTYKTNIFRRYFMKDLGDLEDKYKNIVVMNFNKPGIFPLSNEKYFLDGGYGKGNSHMTKEGAKLFNQILSKRIKKYLLNNKKRNN